MPLHSESTTTITDYFRILFKMSLRLSVTWFSTVYQPDISHCFTNNNEYTAGTYPSHPESTMTHAHIYVLTSPKFLDCHSPPLPQSDLTTNEMIASHAPKMPSHLQPEHWPCLIYEATAPLSQPHTGKAPSLSSHDSQWQRPPYWLLCHQDQKILCITHSH